MARYAQLLRNTQIATEEAPTVWFPMYVLPLASLLQLREMRPHEELMAAGKLEEFDDSLGNAVFVSHQWLGADHPDPEMKQMSVLQGVLTHLMSDLQTIPVDFISEALVPGAKGLPTAALRSRPLFVWYDYFSCPQAEDTSISVECMRRSRSKLCRAVDSIPAYVAKSSFFFALCPIVENTNRSKLLTPTTWTERGWCCAERTFRELSLTKSWIIVRSHTDAQLVLNPVESLGKPPGEGSFTVAGDRCQLQPLLEAGLKRILQNYLKAQDFVGYRVMLNLQAVYLRGYASGLLEPIPGFSDTESDTPTSLALARFMYQNGFESTQEVDRAGWAPLHYAALLGDPAVVKGLLVQRADPNRTTQKGQWRVGMPPWTSALALCLYFKHNGAARALISARARVQSGLLMPPLMTAALANNPEGIRILCDAGCRLRTRNLVGAVALYAAASQGSMLAMEELLAQAARDSEDLQLGAVLCFAAMFHGCSAELVHRLVELRADVNERFNAWEVSKRFGVFNFVQQLPHRFGRNTKLARFSYHSKGATPLLFALLSSQWEGASTFISAGARLDLCNSRGVSPADVLREVQAPDFVMQAMHGNLAGCERVSALACNGSRTEM